MDDEEALKYIELPQETLYLIDKVVRQRAKAGPIGVDNSELINIEIEDEYRAKNQYLESLVKGKKSLQNINESNIDHSQMKNDNKENEDNQRLLDRLTVAASK